MHTSSSVWTLAPLLRRDITVIISPDSLVDISFLFCRYTLSESFIRASVDALCRDETDQISRDPHTKSILTRRERLASLRNAPAVAHGFISSCTYAVIPHTYLQFSTREFAHTRFLDFRVIIIILFFIFFRKPAISKQEQVYALIFPLNASTVDGGVTSHQAIVSVLSHAAAVDRGALPGAH